MMKRQTMISAPPCCKPTGPTEAALCFHCQQPLTDFANLTVTISGVPRPVCCNGCLAAAEFIAEQGLASFYQERDSEQVNKTQHTEANTEFHASDWPIHTHEGLHSITIAVPGLYCSSCAWLIKKTLNDLSANQKLELQTHVMVEAKRISLTWPGQPEQASKQLRTILERINQLGYATLPLSSNEYHQQQYLERENAVFLKRLAVAGLGTMQVMSFAIAHYLGAQASPDIARFLELVSMLVATVVVMYSGQHFFSNAWRDLKNHHLGMDVPVALAIGAAFFPSALQTLTAWDERVLYYDSAVMFVFFLLLGRYVETRARHHFIETADAVSNSVPKRVVVQRGTARLQLAPRDIMEHDELTLSSGQTVPCDALIIGGHAEVDESLISGESQPVLRNSNDTILAGMRVVSGELTIRCQRDWADSSLAKLEQLVQTGRQHVVADRSGLGLLNRYFVLGVLVVTSVVAVFWSAYDASRVFEVVLAMLIASCPCAFALAAPVGTTVASNVLRRHGVLLAKSGALSELAHSTHWWFDKTGTVTKGKPEITSVTTANGTDQEYCLDLLAALERDSRHPLANAFAARASKFIADDIIEVAGAGVRGRINGTPYFAGEASWVEQQVANAISPESPPGSDSQICLANDTQLLACVGLHDSPREGLDQLLKALKVSQVTTTLISGDKHACVDQLQQHSRFDHSFAEQSPQQKLNRLTRLRQLGETVTVVGDGANDAPMLAHADVAIALASGSELSQAQADIVVLNRHLGSLITLQRVAKKSLRIMRQNFAWALGYNAAILPLAAAGYLTPWIAAIGMSLSSLGVVLNATRINRVESQ